MKKLRISAYVSMLTPHLTQWLDRLAERDGICDVTLFCDEPTSADRIALGWPAALTTVSTKTVIGASAEQVKEHVDRAGADAIHIFVGMRHQLCIEAGIAECVRLGRRFGIMHEPRVREGIKGKLRFLQSWLTEGYLRRHADFILAIGEHGPRWFRSTGYRKERIFPFAYFIEPGPFQPRQDISRNALRLGYIGRLDPAKGVTDLMTAMNFVTAPVTLDVVGTGTSKADIDSLASQDSRVQSLGVIPWTDVANHMSTLDVVIQPSRTTDDGWGVVISEALMSGAAVISTSVVGASCCLKTAWRGRIVAPKSPEAIAQAIADISGDDIYSNAARERRSQWARERLSANAGADYTMKIIDHLYFGGSKPNSFLS